MNTPSSPGSAVLLDGDFATRRRPVPVRGADCRGGRSRRGPDQEGVHLSDAEFQEKLGMARTPSRRSLPGKD